MLKSLFSTLAAAGLLFAGSADAQTALTTTRVAAGLSSRSLEGLLVAVQKGATSCQESLIRRKLGLLR